MTKLKWMGLPEGNVAEQKRISKGKDTNKVTPNPKFYIQTLVTFYDL